MVRVGHVSSVLACVTLHLSSTTYIHVNIFSCIIIHTNQQSCTVILFYLTQIMWSNISCELPYHKESYNQKPHIDNYQMTEIKIYITTYLY